MLKEVAITAQLSSPRRPPFPPLASIADALASADQVADFCAAHAAAIDINGAFPAQEFKLIAQSSLLTAPLRPHLGGLGLGIDSPVTWGLLQVLKRIGYGNLAVGRVYEGHVNALQIVQTFGTPAQVEAYARDVRDQHKLFGVWNAEDAHGVKIIPIAQDRYRLEGAKTFCSGAGYVDRPFVNGTLPDGRWQMCIVPMDKVETVSDPSWWQPSGMRATASYRIDFSGVELPGSALIGEPGDYERQPWLTTGVVRFAAVQFGAAEALFDLTRHYLQSLNRSDHPYQQERLGRMAVAIETGNLWLRGAADRITAYAPVFAGEPTQPHPHADTLTAYANMMRTAIEQICIDMIQLCERCVGTRGLLPPSPIDRVIRDLTLYLRQPAYDIAIASPGQHALAHSAPAATLWSYESEH